MAVVSSLRLELPVSAMVLNTWCIFPLKGCKPLTPLRRTLPFTASMSMMEVRNRRCLKTSLTGSLLLPGLRCVYKSDVIPPFPLWRQRVRVAEETMPLLEWCHVSTTLFTHAGVVSCPAISPASLPQLTPDHAYKEGCDVFIASQPFTVGGRGACCST